VERTLKTVPRGAVFCPQTTGTETYAVNFVEHNEQVFAAVDTLVPGSTKAVALPSFSNYNSATTIANLTAWSFSLE
jgi:hypothetical protein